MDDQTLERRAKVAMRLKAARWLKATVAPNAKGKAGYRVVALPPEKLAEHPLLEENKVTASMLGSIERMERRASPMELRTISDALHLPHWWFTVNWQKLDEVPMPDLEEPNQRFESARQLLELYDVLGTMVEGLRAEVSRSPDPGGEFEQELVDAPAQGDTTADDSAAAEPGRGGLGSQ